MADGTDRLARVATAFNSFEFASTKAFLEAHETIVAATPFHLVHNFPHYSNMLGGIPILVPEAQAEQAVLLLQSADESLVDDRRDGWLSRVFILILFLLLAGWAAAPPLSGRVVYPAAAGRRSPTPTRI